MKNLKIYLLILPLLAGMLFTSCKKWLNVPPDGSFTQDQVFSTPVQVQQALNGLYLTMSGNGLYGQSLTMTYPEALAQNYNISSGLSQYSYAATYIYGGLDGAFGTIWNSSYNLTANINLFIKNLDTYKGVVTPTEDSIMRGEAIAMRAFLQFDMLRMFGPAYNSSDSTKLSIPYYKLAGIAVNPYLPANNVMDSIMSDITLSESMLSNDPVITYGVKGDSSINANSFYQRRNCRFNIYAVKALDARVNMYRGNKTAANAAAQYVIQNADAKFPWITAAKAAAVNPDRAFSTEMLFAVATKGLYTSYDALYSDAIVNPVNLLAPTSYNYNTFMETNIYPNDFRIKYQWTIAGNNQPYFIKYKQVPNDTTSFRNYMPVLRKSEMYYIAAECAPDAPTAVSYLNKVRVNRGIANLSTSLTPAQVVTEIGKEYMKEFYGEGQLFFYYKRTNTPTIPSGMAIDATYGPVNMYAKGNNYVLPLPSTESNYHQAK
jgi:hypothetical protein